MLLSTMFTLYVILTVSSLAQLSRAQCENANACYWYGNDKYQCHCQNGAACDSNTGDCSAGCADGWFGSGCQYGSISYTQSDGSTWLTDHDDTTCNNVSPQSITVTLESPVLLTWMRLRHKSVLDGSIQVVYDDSGQTTVCPTNQMNRVDETTLDITCPSSNKVSEMTLSWSGGGSLCSFYISAGRNLALKQNGVTQSSTYVENGQNYDAGKAVDGILQKSGSKDYCTFTETNKGNQDPAWWTLTFDGLVNINKIEVHNGKVNRQRLIGFTLTLYDENSTPLYNYTDPSDPATHVPSPLTIYYLSGICATNVKTIEVVLPKDNENILTLCEVVVYGECVAGYEGDDCTIQCSQGTYGYDCGGTCSSNCRGDGHCNYVDGSCDQGCETGYEPPLCDQECSQGSYGDGCEQNCSPNCGGNGYCDHVDGSCDSGCKAGYKGSICNQICQQGKYGTECKETCNLKCGGNGYCNHINGSCDQGCEAGYLGEICNQQCSEGTYGAGCGMNCSTNCAGDGFCDHEDGECDQGCIAGFDGKLCEQSCRPGTYGEGCQLNCDPRCGGNGYCNHVDGSCDNGCRNGYMGETCNQQCSEGAYGAGCGMNCSTNCAGDGFCHHEDGKCDQGCEAGFDGELCEKKIGSGGDDNGTIIAAAVGASVGILVIVAVIAGILLYRRRAKTEEPGQKTKSESGLGHSEKPNQEDNPYYEIMEVSAPSETAIPVATLKAYLLTHATDSFFDEQFQSVPEIFTQFKTTNAAMEENKTKNRFQNIWPYDRSRVVLSTKGGKPHSDYINATHITTFHNSRSIIASQGPNDTTMNDFMRMLWEKNVNQIVMLTNLVEKGKRKCNQYWPVEGIESFGDLSVELLTTRVYAEYTIRRLRLSQGGKVKRELTQYHFTAWPDKLVPDSPWGLVDIYHRVMADAVPGTLVVHCSAGCGRTGTFIAIHHLMREAEVTGSMDFLSTLKRLRGDRTQMVQTRKQYSFLHLAALAAFMTRNTTIPVKELTDRLRAFYTQKGGSKRGTSENGFNKEFAVTQLCVDLEESTEAAENDGVYANSRTAMNKGKNRLSNILPNEAYRVSLSDDNVKGDIYINAVWVPSFTQNRHDLLTQLPLPNTVTDFWRLVTDYQVSLMLVFDTDIAQADETIGAFLPLKISEVIKDGVFDVTLNQREDSKYWQELKVSVSKGQKSAKSQMKPRVVTCILVKETYLDPGSWVEILNKVKACRSTETSCCLYMCRNGATLSGLACVQRILLDRLEVDQCLAVPLVVGAIKAIRPQVIPTVEQYKLLYEVLKHAHDTSNVYGNVNMKMNVNNTPVVVPLKRASESAYSVPRSDAQSAYSVSRPTSDSAYSDPRSAINKAALQPSGNVYGNIQEVGNQIMSAANPPQPAKRTIREGDLQEPSAPGKPVPPAKPTSSRESNGNSKSKVESASDPPKSRNPSLTKGESKSPVKDKKPAPSNVYGNIKL